MLQNRIAVQPGPLHGCLNAPPSKSVMQRICAAIWIKGGRARITNPGNSADDQVMMALLCAAGCGMQYDEQGALLIDAVKADRHVLETAHFRESGLAARMCIPILALGGRDMTLAADESLSKRPMGFFADVFPKLGLTIALHDGHLPATMSGRLRPANITVDGSVSSQFITGLLMAYAGAAARDVAITVTNAASTPYTALTLEVMRAAGLNVPQQRADNYYYFEGAEMPVTNDVIDFAVEGDWSNAAFWLVAGAIAGPVVIKGLNAFSMQADNAMLAALMDSGAAVSVESAQITVSPAPLRAFHFNANNCPDLFPPLAVLACYANGTSVIEGISRLKHKESNRAETILLELSRMGADITLQDDNMLIRGGKPLSGATTSAHNDHRIAMMCAIAALRANAPVIIEGAAAVEKSYPSFFDDLQKLGGRVGVAE